MRGKYIGLLVMMLFAFVMFFAPTGASSAGCDEGFTRTYYIEADGSINPNGTMCIKAVDPFPKTDTCSTRTGETTKYTYSWEIKSVQDIDDSLSQVNVEIPSSEECIIQKVCESAKDQSRKILPYDPTTKFSIDDLTRDVVSFDASKSGPNTWSISIDLNVGGKRSTTAELKTGTGLQYALTDGPDCCSSTEQLTAIEYTPRSFGLTSGPTFNVTFNNCTGELNDIVGCTEQPYGAFICEGDPSDRCPSNKWDLLKNSGPRAGAPLITINLSTGEFESFFAYGSTVYSCGVTPVGFSQDCKPVETDEKVDPDCVDDPNAVPPFVCDRVDVVYEVVNYSNGFQVELNSCNEPINIFKCDPTDPSVCNTPVLPTNLLLAIGKANGQPDTSTIYQIIAGTRNNSLLTGSSYLCQRYGIGCQN